MVFLVSGSGERTAESFDGVSSAAPLLHVEFGSDANQPPTVNVSQPSDGSSFDEGSTVAFSGTASDDEDGNLTGSLAWTSSLDGPIGSGGSFSRTDLSPGSHTITASVTDSGGRNGSDSISITIDAVGTPTVSISAPANGSSINLGDSVTLTGTASDPEQGNLSGGIIWSSSIDAGLGTGASILASGLSAGAHAITASVTDNDGNTASDTITLIVSTEPSLSIDSPASGSVFDEGQTVTLTGTATDPDEGDLSGSILWSSGLAGSLGTGASLSTSSLAPGVHLITASVTDSGGLGAEDTITLTVNAVPTIQITAPSDGAVVSQSAPVTFSATAIDAEDGDLAGNVTWSSSKQGSLGTGGTISVPLTSRGKHTITAIVTDSGGSQASASISVRVRR
jgi:hypothetical protein